MKVRSKKKKLVKDIVKEVEEGKQLKDEIRGNS